MTYEDRLKARVGKDTIVENGYRNREFFGFSGPIIEVVRNKNGLHVDVDYGYSFWIDESQPLKISEPENPNPVGEWVRETHPHLFVKK